MNLAWAWTSLPPMFRTCRFLIIAIAWSPASVRRAVQKLPKPSPGQVSRFTLRWSCSIIALFDDVSIVGLVDQEWPERPRRNIFYSPACSRRWAGRRKRIAAAAADARFIDLLGFGVAPVAGVDVHARRRGDRLASLQLDEIPRARLSTIARDASRRGAGFRRRGPVARTGCARSRSSRGAVVGRTAHDAFARRRAGFSRNMRPVLATAMPARASGRSARSRPISTARSSFSRSTSSARRRARRRRGDGSAAQGQFVHEVFEAFFNRVAGGADIAAITPGNLDDARADVRGGRRRALERAVRDRGGARADPAAWIVGRGRPRRSGACAWKPSAVSPSSSACSSTGWKASSPLRRRRPARVSLSGKADRVDLLEDGTFRLIDYKLGWPPNRARALQLPDLQPLRRTAAAGHRGRNWTLGEAAYLAFKGPRRVVPLFASPADRERCSPTHSSAWSTRLTPSRAANFPRAGRCVSCETCSFAAVCRKDYVGDV